MNNFGLGLILNFTDNATSGVQRATGAFNHLENAIDGVVGATSRNQALLQFAYAASEAGKMLYNVGRSITSVFAEATNYIIDVGNTLNNASTQLAHLYGSAEQGNAVLERIKQYAAKTVFGAEELIPTVVMLKSHGIEAFDEIATSAYKASNGVKGYSQTILDYASDLAAFNPNMNNIYGKGIEAAMGAIKEFIAEGNAQFLKRGASLDINQLLGEKTADTAEERARQVADLIEKMGMVGMTANLASTPMQKLANISDTFYNIVSDIANSGVMDLYNRLLSKISEYIANIPQEELKTIARVISSALVELLEPLEVVVDFVIQVVDKLRELVRENPELVKTIVKTVALVGVFSIISGTVLRLLAAVGNLKIALSGLFGGNLLTLGFKFLGILKTALIYFGPIIAAVVLLKGAWDRNLLGMQDSLKKFVRDTIDTFKILFDAWGDYALSEDNFERAKELGILPFIEAILQLKYHLGFLFKGIKSGFDAFFDQLGKILVKVGILDKETHGFRDLITSLLEKITAPGMTDNWEKAGYWIGNIGGWLLVVVAVLPVILKTISAIATVAKGIGSVISFISKTGIFVKLASVFKDIAFYIQYAAYSFKVDALPSILSGLKTIGVAILGVVTMPIVAIPLIIAAAVAAIYEIFKHWDDIEAFGAKMYDRVQERLQMIRGLIALFWNNVLKDTPIGNFIEQYIVPFVLKIYEVQAKVRNILSNVFNFIRNLFVTIYNVAFPIILKIRDLITTVVSSVVKVVTSVARTIGKIFYAVYEIIRTIVLAVMVAFKWLYEHIIKPIVDTIAEAFNWVKEHIIDPIVEKVTDIIDGIAQKIRWLKEKIIEPIFNGIYDFVTTAVQKIKDFVMPIIDTISTAISWIADAISAAVDAVGEFFGGIGDFFKGVGDELESMLGLSTGGYVKETGAAVLHPNEVVINDVLTQRLGNFLEDYDRSRNVPVPVTTSIAPYRETPMQSFNNSVSNDNSDTEIDNSVVFESGSIVFQIDKDTDLANMSEAELNAVAEKLLKIMARKAQLRQMQTRR